MMQASHQSDAVVDVTKPAFEGIADWTQEQVEEYGDLLAEQVLQDYGYTIEHPVAINDTTGEHLCIALYDETGEHHAVLVCSRRVLGCKPEEVPALNIVPSEDLNNLLSNDGLCDGLVLSAVIVTFLSDRLAHITHMSHIQAA